MAKVVAFLFMAVALALAACGSTPEVGVSGLATRVWLRKLDPAAEVIRVICVGEVEYPPGNMQKIRMERTYSAKEVLEQATWNPTLGWESLVDLVASELGKERWIVQALNDVLGISERDAIRRWFANKVTPLKTTDLTCEGEQLKWPPPVQYGSCPQDANGCPELPPGAEEPGASTGTGGGTLPPGTDPPPPGDHL